MTAYSINDNNYIKLRDVGKAMNFSVTYAEQTDSVYIDRSLPYGTEITEIPQATPEPNPTNGKTPITEKVIDGTEWAREDFSQQANPAIFDNLYTRGAYNAIKQSIVDRDIIIPDNDSNGLNPYYYYANFVDTGFSYSTTGESYLAANSAIWYISGYYNYELGVEPYTKDYAKHLGYRVCKPSIPSTLAVANDATDSFITEVVALQSVRERAKRINDYVCEKMNYGNGNGSDLNALFSSETPLLGTCGSYASAFLYLCQRAGIPNVMVKSIDHGWNEIYVDGAWHIVDVTLSDVDSPNYAAGFMLTAHPRDIDVNPNRTAFCKEILVSNSTK
jgi:transglutaminase-like putative cysteine protease